MFGHVHSLLLYLVCLLNRLQQLSECIEQTAFAPTYNKQTIAFWCPFPGQCHSLCRMHTCVCGVVCMLIILTNSIEILQAMRCDAMQYKAKETCNREHHGQQRHVALAIPHHSINKWNNRFLFSVLFVKDLFTLNLFLDTSFEISETPALFLSPSLPRCSSLSHRTWNDHFRLFTESF